jgi:hypothetical protein
MKSRYYFEQFSKDIKKEHKLFDTHQESTEHLKERCDHKGKVKIVGHDLICGCGASWQGPQIETLYKLLTNNV